MNLSNKHSKLNLSLELTWSSHNLFIELNNKNLSNELSNQNMSNKSSLQYDLYHNDEFCIRVKKKNLMSSIPSFHCFKSFTLWNAIISVGNFVFISLQNPNDISYVYSGYAPLSIRLAQYHARPGWRSITEVLNLLPGPTIEEIQQIPVALRKRRECNKIPPGSL